MTVKISPNKADTKAKTLQETLVNTLGGYPLAYSLGIVILPLSAEWIISEPLQANLAISLCFASLSFVRIFVIRRIFTKLGYDDNIIRLAIMAYRKGLCKIKSKESRKNEKNPKTISK